MCDNTVMLQLFGILSGLLPVIGVLPYTRDILRHKTKPHRGSFLIWAILSAIAFFTQLADGATWSLFLPATSTLTTIIIFILAIKFGVSGLSKTDVAALLLAGLGLVLWYLTKQPLTALLITIGIDTIGTILTLIKTYRAPHSETFSSWLLACVGGFFAILSVGELSFGLLVYPIYVFIANGLVALVILIAKPKLNRQRPLST